MTSKPGILYSCLPSYELIFTCERSTELKETHLIQNRGLGLDCIHREVRCTDLLGNASSFAFLNVGLSNLNTAA